MPADREDRHFGAKPGSANKALAGLVAHYGWKKGQEVYYRLLNDRRGAGKTYGGRK